MRNWRTSLVSGLVSAAVAFSGSLAWAQDAETEEQEENPLALTLSTAFMTDYMWRGFDLYDGSSIQPEVEASYSLGEYGAITGDVWAHLPAEGDRQDEKFSEVDYTLEYGITFEPFELAVGHYWYSYPTDNTNSMKRTAEYYATAALLDTPLNPTLGFYQDYDEYDNQYYELGFSHTIECPALLGEGFNMTPYATFGFASNSEKVYADDGLVHITVGASFNLKLGDIDVIPSINYTFEDDDALRNQFWSGVAFSYSL